MVGALTDPFGDCHMGVTAENVAAEVGISRESQDKMAAESHRRAARCDDKGYFKAQIMPVEARQEGHRRRWWPTSTSGPTARRRSWPGCNRYSPMTAR